MPFVQRIPIYAALLICLLILIIAVPLVPADWPGHVLEFFFNLVLLVGVYSAAWRSSHRWPFVILTLVTLGARWSDQLSLHIGFDAASYALTEVWIAYAIVIIVAALYREREVTVNVILGAIVVYLLAALAFAELYGMIETLQPGSFAGLPTEKVTNALIYFSLVCMTTMTFGDILPSSNLARSLSVVQAAFAMFYVAIMIARLVGLNIVSAGEKNRSSSTR